MSQASPFPSVTVCLPRPAAVPAETPPAVNSKIPNPTTLKSRILIYLPPCAAFGLLEAGLAYDYRRETPTLSDSFSEAGVSSFCCVPDGGRDFRVCATIHYTAQPSTLSVRTHFVALQETPN